MSQFWKDAFAMDSIPFIVFCLFILSCVLGAFRK